MDTIIIQCLRPDLGTEYVQLTIDPLGLDIAFGNLIYLGYFSSTAAEKEFVSIVENPELEALHDGRGWNLDELAAWVRQFEVVTC